VLLSNRERLLLDALKQTGSVKEAAYFLSTHTNPDIRDEKMTPPIAYQMLHRIRWRYVDARSFINTVLAYRKSNNLLRRVLAAPSKTEREAREEEEVEDEEEDE